MLFSSREKKFFWKKIVSSQYLGMTQSIPDLTTQLPQGNAIAFNVEELNGDKSVLSVPLFSRPRSEALFQFRWHRCSCDHIVSSGQKIARGDRYTHPVSVYCCDKHTDGGQTFY